MKNPAFRVQPMKSSHLKQCEAIVRASNPWKRLNEQIDFRAVLKPNRTNTVAYVCSAGNEVAGFVLFIPEPVFARGGYLRAIAVSPGFRGRGIGKKLLSFAEKKASAHSLHFFLCASSFNRSAHSFYKRCGYSRAGKLRDLIMAGASEYIYWKRLKPGSSKS